MKYIVIRASDDEDLQNQVNNKISEGYKPKGGICTHVQAGIAKRLIQAMVKK